MKHKFLSTLIATSMLTQILAPPIKVLADEVSIPTPSLPKLSDDSEKNKTSHLPNTEESKKNPSENTTNPTDNKDKGKDSNSPTLTIKGDVPVDVKNRPHVWVDNSIQTNVGNTVSVSGKKQVLYPLILDYIQGDFNSGIPIPKNLLNKASMPELDRADLIDYRGFVDNSKGTKFVLNNLMSSDYKRAITWLSEHQIVNGFVGLKFTPNAKNNMHSITLLEDNKYFNNYIKEGNFYVSAPANKADFLMALMKSVDGIEYSRPVLINHRPIDDVSCKPYPYGGMDASTTKYQKYLVDKGINNSINDIKINMYKYGAEALVVNPNVYELYFNKAVDNGIITLDEFKQNNQFVLEYISDRTCNVDLNSIGHNTYRTRWNNKLDPVRIGFNITDVKNFIGHRMDSQNYIRNSKIFGSAYTYSGDKGVNPIDDKKNPILPIKDGNKSTSNGIALNVDILSEYYDFLRGKIKQKDMKVTPYLKNYNFTRFDRASQTDDQYYKFCINLSNEGKDSFFTDAKMSYLECFTYIYRALNAYDKTRLTKKEVKSVLSKFGVKFKDLTEHDLATVSYLIAKGLINPEEFDIVDLRKTITTEDAYILLYRLANPDARFKMDFTVSDLDNTMIKQGYGKSKVKLQNIKGSVVKAKKIISNKPVKNQKKYTVYVNTPNNKFRLKDKNGNYITVYTIQGHLTVKGTTFIKFDIEAQHLIDGCYITDLNNHVLGYINNSGIYTYSNEDGFHGYSIIYSRDSALTIPPVIQALQRYLQPLLNYKFINAEDVSPSGEHTTEDDNAGYIDPNSKRSDFEKYSRFKDGLDTESEEQNNKTRLNALIDQFLHYTREGNTEKCNELRSLIRDYDIKDVTKALEQHDSLNNPNYDSSNPKDTKSDTDDSDTDNDTDNSTLIDSIKNTINGGLMFSRVEAMSKPKLKPIRLKSCTLRFDTGKCILSLDDGKFNITPKTNKPSITCCPTTQIAIENAYGKQRVKKQLPIPDVKEQQLNQDKNIFTKELQQFNDPADSSIVQITLDAQNRDAYMYSMVPVFTADGLNDLFIHKYKEGNSSGKISIVSQNKTQIVLQAESKDLSANDLLQMLLNRINLNSDPNAEKSVASYTKIISGETNNRKLTLVSDKELEKIGVRVISTSTGLCNVLANTKTDLKAYISQKNHRAIVGNDVRIYDNKTDLMCKGGRNHFYNFDVVASLFSNDLDTSRLNNATLVNAYRPSGTAHTAVQWNAGGASTVVCDNPRVYTSPDKSKQLCKYENYSDYPIGNNCDLYSGSGGYYVDINTVNGGINNFVSFSIPVTKDNALSKGLVAFVPHNMVIPHVKENTIYGSAKRYIEDMKLNSEYNALTKGNNMVKAKENLLVNNTVIHTALRTKDIMSASATILHPLGKTVEKQGIISSSFTTNCFMTPIVNLYVEVKNDSEIPQKASQAVDKFIDDLASSYTDSRQYRFSKYSLSIKIGDLSAPHNNTKEVANFFASRFAVDTKSPTGVNYLSNSKYASDFNTANDMGRLIHINILKHADNTLERKNVYASKGHGYNSYIGKNGNIFVPLSGIGSYTGTETCKSVSQRYLGYRCYAESTSRSKTGYAITRYAPTRYLGLPGTTVPLEAIAPDNSVKIGDDDVNPLYYTVHPTYTYSNVRGDKTNLYCTQVGTYLLGNYVHEALAPCAKFHSKANWELTNIYLKNINERAISDLATIGLRRQDIIAPLTRASGDKMGSMVQMIPTKYELLSGLNGNYAWWEDPKTRTSTAPPGKRDIFVPYAYLDASPPDKNKNTIWFKKDVRLINATITDGKYVNFGSEIGYSDILSAVNKYKKTAYGRPQAQIKYGTAIVDVEHGMKLIPYNTGTRYVKKLEPICNLTTAIINSLADSKGSSLYLYKAPKGAIIRLSNNTFGVKVSEESDTPQNVSMIIPTCLGVSNVEYTTLIPSAIKTAEYLTNIPLNVIGYTQPLINVADLKSFTPPTKTELSYGFTSVSKYMPEDYKNVIKKFNHLSTYVVDSYGKNSITKLYTSTFTEQGGWGSPALGSMHYQYDFCVVPRFDLNGQLRIAKEAGTDVSIKANKAQGNNSNNSSAKTTQMPANMPKQLKDAPIYYVTGVDSLSGLNLSALNYYAIAFANGDSLENELTLWRDFRDLQLGSVVIPNRSLADNAYAYNQQLESLYSSSQRLGALLSSLKLLITTIMACYCLILMALLIMLRFDNFKSLFASDRGCKIIKIMTFGKYDNPYNIDFMDNFLKLILIGSLICTIYLVSLPNFFIKLNKTAFDIADTLVSNFRGMK